MATHLFIRVQIPRICKLGVVQISSNREIKDFLGILGDFSGGVKEADSKIDWSRNLPKI
jgi:hypothetical protein